MGRMEFVAKDSQSKRYRIGPRFRALFPSTYEQLKQVALPTILALSKSLGVTVALRVREGDQMVIIDRVESEDLLRVSYPIGFKHPISFGSSGKLFLAFLPREEAQLVLEAASTSGGNGRVKSTGIGRVWDELRKIRKKGYAIGRGVVVKGTMSVAIPLFSSGERVVAIISLSWPIVKYPPSALKNILRKGIKATEEVSKILSGDLSKQVVSKCRGCAGL